MASMEAILKIRAEATGQAGVRELDGLIRRLGPGAVASVNGVARLGQGIGAATSAANRMTSATGLMGQALGQLGPVLSVAGLTAMVQKQIEAGDKMNDLSQRYGVGVEQLAKFDKAAKVSGTNLESVGTSLGKLSKGLYQMKESGSGPVNEALTKLGISATDASGKLKSADEIMLEVANRFKTMPDGVEKTALAMQLFGKSGAEMIPMLNQGGDAIDKMKVKMTAAFAEKADEYNDKLITLSGKIGGLARVVTVAALPALTKLADGLTFLVDGFSKLPEPVQAVAGGVAIISVGLAALATPIAILTPLFASLGTTIAGLKIGAAIAGWAGAAAPAIATVTSVLGGLLTWLGSVFLPTIVGIFSGPVGWIALAVAAIVAGVIFFREPIMKFFEWVGKGIGQIAGIIVKGIDEKIIKPVIGMFSGIWREIGTPVTNALKNVSWLIMEAAKGYYGLLYQFTLKPFVDGIIGLWSLIEQPLTQLWEGFKTKAAEAFAFLAPALQVAWDSMLLSAQTFLAPYTVIWESIKKPATDFASYLGTFLDKKWEAVLTYANENFVGPWNEFWKGIAKTIADTAKAMEVGIGNIWKKIIDFANKTFIKPWEEFWDLLTSKPEEFQKKINSIGESLSKNFLEWFKSLPTLVGKAWDEALYKIARVTNYLNREAVLALNNLLRGYNAIAVVSKGFLPTFKEIPVPAQIPLLAKGAHLNRPTLAMVAEAGQSEYVVPASAMPAAVEGWQQGLRGDALARAWQSPGSLSPGSSLPGAGAPVSTGSGAMAAGGGGAVVGRAPMSLTIKTGPVLQQPDGSRWVSLDELPAIAEAIHRSAVAGAVDATMALQGSAAMRSVQGWS